ncbi:phosphotransferase [Sphingosinicella soli]|uniref:Aminoglycoside phosphotransferase (APT) family kinase protein n=1 Tax=Sphingosinicella soli TaxID=333708 RepID=A0A7W7B0W1_9SPHN|nr:phosphotransferase [Sphingosinicella soli]MBB4631975.1 aminoglycoside phosphotransferase (APT) family kinase protein [Sphingosinicella soli]
MMTSDPADAPLSPAAEAWLERHVDGYSGPGVLTKFGFGQSNPTFRLSTASGDYVLRRKPLGRLLAKAHAIEREFRVLRALDGGTVPVPRAHALCEDPSLLGAPFFVMDFAEGRIFYDQRLPGVAPDERVAIFDGMNAAVAGLHSIDPFAIGLEGYGRPDNFVERQVSIWTRQYRASEGEAIPAMERLIDWLPRHLPREQPVRIFHGDLRLDNMIFHPTEPRVVALLDWELSTLGDPVADFAYHMMVWRIGADLFRGFADLDRASLGIPEEADYLRRYCERTSRSELPHWKFYLAFSLFRVAAILQGVSRRAQNGNASSDDAAEVGGKAAPLAAIGWEIAGS